MSIKTKPIEKLEQKHFRLNFFPTLRTSSLPTNKSVLAPSRKGQPNNLVRRNIVYNDCA
jgi:hypothetical protein